MAERPEDLNLPNAVITRIIKEAVSEHRHTAAVTMSRARLVFLFYTRRGWLNTLNKYTTQFWQVAGDPD